MNTESNQHSIRELLGIVADPETPEARDAAWNSIEEQLEAAHRELRFALMVEPEDHRAQWTEKRTCAYVTPDCLWCSIRRVLASNPAKERP